MDDLSGSASDRLAWLEERRGQIGFGEAWLIRQLTTALQELADVEPVADADRERRVDY